MICGTQFDPGTTELAPKSHSNATTNETHRPPSAVRRLSSAVRRPPSAVHRPSSIVISSGGYIDQANLFPAS
jgi:hypothetical protein